jgi:hypothetical protein
VKPAASPYVFYTIQRTWQGRSLRFAVVGYDLHAGRGPEPLGPILVISPRLRTLALVCMKVNALALCGGFASVPLVLHELVEVRPWLEAKSFMDGIALGQMTPGPIVVTATFVGYRVARLAGASWRP